MVGEHCFCEENFEHVVPVVKSSPAKMVRQKSLAIWLTRESACEHLHKNYLNTSIIGEKEFHDSQLDVAMH